MRWTLSGAGLLALSALAVAARADTEGMESKVTPRAMAVPVQADHAAPVAPDPDVVSSSEPILLSAPMAAAELIAEPAPAPAASSGGATSPAPATGRPTRGYPQSPAPAPWKIPQPRLFQRLGVNMGGWVQQGLTFNGDDPADGFNGPVSTNDRANDYELNQTWLYFIRPTNTQDGGFDIGGRVDLCYGTDWRFGKALGLEDRINADDTTYGLVIPQFYAEVAYNRLSVKLGHYATRFGYEMVPAVGNFFYSHSYTMCYTEPLLVTGLEADYRLTDRLTMVAGFNRGWMMFEDFNDELDFLGGFVWTSDSKHTSVKFMTTTGPQDAAGEHNRFAYGLVVQQDLSKKLKYVIQHNLGYEDNGDPRNGNDAEWYGILQHLVYTISPQLALGGRFEWLRDDDGSRVAGVGNWIGSDAGWLGAPGFAGNFYECSLGFNWRPHPNLVVRPELRYDWYDGTTNLANQLPFDGGRSDNQLLVAGDLIVTF